MKHDCKHEELIELGSATGETRGGIFGVEDQERTLQPALGLTRD